MFAYFRRNDAAGLGSSLPDWGRRLRGAPHTSAADKVASHAQNRALRAMRSIGPANTALSPIWAKKTSFLGNRERDATPSGAPPLAADAQSPSAPRPTAHVQRDKYSWVTGRIQAAVSLWATGTSSQRAGISKSPPARGRSRIAPPEAGPYRHWNAHPCLAHSDSACGDIDGQYEDGCSSTGQTKEVRSYRNLGKRGPAQPLNGGGAATPAPRTREGKALPARGHSAHAVSATESCRQPSYRRRR